MPAILDQGVCVRVWDWSETSQTVTLLTRSLGLVRGLAKGSKRSTHPYSGGLELLTRGNVGVIHRPSAELALITEWDLQETFPVLRRSLRAHHVGLYLAELIQLAVHDHDPHPRLYDELVIALRSLGVADGAGGTISQGTPALLRFQWALLLETGYKPELEHDIERTRSLSKAASYEFDPRLGGFVQRGLPTAELGDGPPDQAGTRWKVRHETLEVLRRIQAAMLTPVLKPDETPAGDAPPPAPSGLASHPAADPAAPRASHAAHERACRFLASYLRFVFGREPKMLSVLFGTTLPR